MGPLSNQVSHKRGVADRKEEDHAMRSMLDVLTDPDIAPSRFFVYGGFDPNASKHLLTDDLPTAPWADRFPIGRTVVTVLPPSGTGRVRFEMLNLDTSDSDVWAGRANAARCLLNPNACVPRERQVRHDVPANIAIPSDDPFGPRTTYVKFVRAIALSRRQKNHAFDLLRLKRALICRGLTGIHLKGQIERLSAASPLSAVIIKAQVERYLRGRSKRS